jgi:hypothetical protein
MIESGGHAINHLAVQGKKGSEPVEEGRAIGTGWMAVAVYSDQLSRFDCGDPLETVEEGATIAYSGGPFVADILEHAVGGRQSVDPYVLIDSTPTHLGTTPQLSR